MAENPDRFNSDLAHSLHNLGFCFGELKEFEDAAKYTLQSVKIYQGLAREDPKKFNADLAMSLHNLSCYLRELGEYRESVKYAQQASDLRRDLFQQNPDDVIIKKWFPRSLRSATLSSEKLGNHEDVVKFGREAIPLYRSLVRDHPDQNWFFKECLRALGPSLAILGFADEAIEVTQELKRVQREIEKAPV